MSEVFKKGQKVRWVVETFPDGFKIYHEGHIESFWGTEGSVSLWWVQPTRRNNPESISEGCLELVEA